MNKRLILIVLDTLQADILESSETEENKNWSLGTINRIVKELNK